MQSKFDPEMDEDAEILIQNYYQHLRSNELHGNLKYKLCLIVCVIWRRKFLGKTTIRALESLVRLSQAHARLMFKDKVERFDAVCIVVLMECACFTGLLDNFEFSEHILMDHFTYQYGLPNIIKGFYYFTFKL